MIMYELLGLDMNNFNYATVCKLFVLDRNTWYHIEILRTGAVVENAQVPPQSVKMSRT